MSEGGMGGGADSNSPNKSILSLPPGAVPPHNLEAERSVLGAILVQNEAIDVAREAGLEGRDFYREAHHQIFEAACSLSDRRQPIYLITLT